MEKSPQNFCDALIWENDLQNFFNSLIEENNEIYSAVFQNNIDLRCYEEMFDSDNEEGEKTKIKEKRKPLKDEKQKNTCNLKNENCCGVCLVLINNS